MIRIRSFLLGFASLLIVSGLMSCAGSSGGRRPSSSEAPAGGPQEWRPAPPGPHNPAVGIVNGRYITRHDVDSVLATAPPSIREDYQKDPEQYKQLVERIANQEAMYQAAMKAGTDRSPGYVSDVRAQERQLL
ncbi:MAG: hypothetical protein E6K75_02145, partial [Candidatus Eisenbacteria bacterium]